MLGNIDWQSTQAFKRVNQTNYQFILRMKLSVELKIILAFTDNEETDDFVNCMKNFNEIFPRNSCSL